VALTVSVLRELFRHYQAFLALYETDGIDTIVGPDGDAFSLWDVQYLACQLHRLPSRQSEAIRLCLIENVKESDAAVRMGVSETNPVAKYATSGLEKIVQMVQAGALPRFLEGAWEEVS
jgi:DNA-directed RNA polymerase specialized sigma24 family protein